jgi:hypothetical protein
MMAMKRIVAALAPFLASRSFAPSAIRVRLTKMTPMPKLAEHTEISGLEDIADLYNHYRLGIMQNPPDLASVSIPQSFSEKIEGDVKTASDSVSLSTLMTSLAYWPGLSLGLHTSAEGNTPEDAATQTNPLDGEIHVTP